MPVTRRRQKSRVREGVWWDARGELMGNIGLRPWGAKGSTAGEAKQHRDTSRHPSTTAGGNYTAVHWLRPEHFVIFASLRMTIQVNGGEP